MGQLKSQQTIKNIKSQLTIAKANREDLKVQSIKLQQDLAAQDQHIGRLETVLERHNGNKKVFVTEHAMIRYIQRIMEIDLEELKKTILPEGIKKQIEMLGGNGKFPTDKCIVVAQNNAITTVLSKDQENNKE